MKTILLLLLPITLLAQPRNNDPLIKARRNAHISVACIGVGSVMAAGMLASDTDNAPQASAVFSTFGAAGMVFYVVAWHHVGEAAKDRRISYYISPVGGGIKISLN